MPLVDDPGDLFPKMHIFPTFPKPALTIQSVHESVKHFVRK